MSKWEPVLRGHEGKMPRMWHYVISEVAHAFCETKLPPQTYKGISGEGKWLDQMCSECIRRLKNRDRIWKKK